jgi:hypothetical protein
VGLLLLLLLLLLAEVPLNSDSAMHSHQFATCGYPYKSLSRK